MDGAGIAAEEVAGEGTEVAQWQGWFGKFSLGYFRAFRALRSSLLRFSEVFHPNQS